MNAQELVQKAMQRTGLDSARKLADALDVSNVAVSKWLNGTNCPTFEQAAVLAELAGLPPVPTAAEVRLHSKDGERYRGLLRRIANIAAAVALTLSFGRLDVHASNAPGADYSAHNPVTNVYYVKLYK